MTKTELQKELLEKVKPGTKPSTIKKQKKVKPKTDEGYESDKSNKYIPTPPPLPNSQISALQKKIEIQEAIKKADEEVKEQLQQTIKDLEKKNKELYKTIEELKNKGESKENPKQEQFNCYNCKKDQDLSLLVLELPEGKLCQPCWTTLRKKTKESLKEIPNPKPNQPFTCIVCDQEKQETPIYKQVDISYKNLIKGKEYPVCSACSPQVKEYNENENRELEEWE